VVWSAGGEPTVLKALNAKKPSATVVAMNSSGQSAGWSYGTDGTPHAVLWSASGRVTDLGVGVATCMNDAGQVAGVYAGSLGVLWSPNHAPQYLSPLTSVTAINASGQVVGGTGSHAALWTNGMFVDLNTMIGTDWSNTSALGINDAGQIIGMGYHKGSFDKQSGPFIITLSRDFYNTAYQNIKTTAAAGDFTINTPVVGAADYHSLAALTVATTNSQQIVEVGWSVDPVRNGDAEPHLFVFHWVDHDAGQSCYPHNATELCGFVLNGTPAILPWSSLAGVSSPLQFQIAYQNGNWNIFVGGQLIGWFPGTLWNSTFTEADVVEWSGEASASTTQPQTQMGNGIFGTQSGSAEITDLTYLTSAGTPISATPKFTVTNPSFYAAFFDTAAQAFDYGGPGFH